MRYRAPIILVAPEDSRSFVGASIAGVAVLWIASLAQAFSAPIASALDFLLILGQWWTPSGLGALWWPGFLLICCSIAVQVRLRTPETGRWKPKPPTSDFVNRKILIPATVFWIFGLLCLVFPDVMLDILFSGRAAPEAYAAFQFSPDFYPLPAALILSLLVAHIALLIVVIYRGHKTTQTKRLELVLNIALTGLLAWVTSADQIYVAAEADGIVKLIVGIIVFFSLIDIEFGIYRQLLTGRTVRLPV